MKTKLEFSATAPEEKGLKNNYFNNRILDVKLFRDPDTQLIYIGFDLITSDFAARSHLPLRLKETFGYPSSFTHEVKILADILETSKEEEKQFLSSLPEQNTVKDKSSNYLFAKNSIIYQLPTNPNAALNWLGAFIVYLNKYIGNACVHFKDYTQEASCDLFMQGINDVICLHLYQKENNVNETIHIKLIEAILALKDENKDIYLDAFKAITAVYNRYSKDRENKIYINFVAYLQDNIRLSILNERPLIEQARAAIHNGSGPEKTFKAHNQWVITQLLASTIDKVAHDGGNYKWTYTEFYFLQNAEFAVTAEGKLSIVALDKNSEYNRVYAPGKRNEAIFEPELQFIAKTLKLAFDKPKFKENGIVFDAKSTENLLQRGIICIEEKIKEIKKELYAQNFWSFFGACKVDEPGRGTNILQLPRDAMKIIQEELECQRSL